MGDTVIFGNTLYRTSYFRRNHITGELNKSFCDFILQYENRQIQQYEPLDSNLYMLYDFNTETGDTFENYCAGTRSMIQVRMDSTIIGIILVFHSAYKLNKRATNKSVI